MSSTAYEYETGQQEAFYESVTSAARQGQQHKQLGLLAMRAARAALTEGNHACGCDGADGELENGAAQEWEGSPAYFHQSFATESQPSALLMDHLAHAAAEAESDGEAFAFLAPLLPMAMKALPKLAMSLGKKFLPQIASKLFKTAPKLTQGVQGAARALRATSAGKPLVRALPDVVRKTTADLAQQLAKGFDVTQESALKMLARNTAGMLSNPRIVIKCVNNSRETDRRVHRALSGRGSAPCSCQ